MESKVISNYLNTLMHLRIAKPYLDDIMLINQELNNFDYTSATDLISYIANKHKSDFNTIGKHLTGIMVFGERELPEKTDADLINDLNYIKTCIIISGAVHCGIENTLHSAIVKINREQENNQ